MAAVGELLVPAESRLSGSVFAVAGAMVAAGNPLRYGIPMQSEDYVERMIRQVAAAIARALGLAKGAQFTEAQRELEGAWIGAVGLRRADALRLDPDALRSLLAGKTEAAALLLDAQADLDASCGELEPAAQARELAAALRTAPPNAGPA